MKFRLFMKCVAVVTFIFTLISLYMPSAYAADEADGKKDKSARRAALMMQKMKQDMELQNQQEKAALQAKFDADIKTLQDKLKQKDDDLKKLTAEASATRRKASNLETDLSKTNKENTVVEAKLQQTQSAVESTKKNLADSNSELKQTQSELKASEQQRKTLVANAALTTKSLIQCETKNANLFGFGSDLIKMYENPSQYQSILQKEKFTQLKRVELENLLQEYQDKIDEQHLTSVGQ